MYTEAKKLHIIEEVLKINNDAALADLEDFIKKAAKDHTTKEVSNFGDFSGIWSKDEAEEIERIIESH